MQSTQDQDFDQSNINDQAEVSEEANTEHSQTFEVNGQNLTASELLDNYKKLQKEYTQSRQELSETKKTSSMTEDERSALEFIKSNGFVTKEDLEKSYMSQQRELQLKDILSSNPDLQPFESAIKQLGQVSNESYDEIIEKYGFKSKDKLAKARSQGDIKGTPQKNKSISDMSDEEYEKFRVKMGIGTRGTFS